nr:MAG TPA: hypothetical protein [Caudoviricetes sp.]
MYAITHPSDSKVIFLIELTDASNIRSKLL